MPQGPSGKLRVIRGKAKFAAIHQQFGEARDNRRGDDSPFVVALFRPRVGKQQNQAGQAGRGEACDQEARIFRENPHIRQAVGRNPAEQRRDAIQIGFAADKSDIRVARRLPGEMLAGAKSDLKPEMFFFTSGKNAAGSIGSSSGSSSIASLGSNSRIKA